MCILVAFAAQAGGGGKIRNSIPLATPESWIFCVAVTTIMKFLIFFQIV